MNSKNKNILLFVCVFVILVVFLDLIFNFSNLFIENFQSSTVPASEEPEVEVNKKFKRIISKVSGKSFDITYNSNDDSIIYIKSPSNNKFNLSVNLDGTLSEDSVIEQLPSQQFSIVKVENNQEYNDLLSKNGDTGSRLDTFDTECTSPPFYLIISRAESKTKIPWCLSYQSGNIFVNPIGNYDNQKWDVSMYSINDKSFCTNNMGNTNAGSLRVVPDREHSTFYNKDKIKLDFKIEDDLKKRLLGEDSEENDEDDEKCPVFLHKRSIHSLCPGCDTDKL